MTEQKTAPKKAQLAYEFAQAYAAQMRQAEIEGAPSFTVPKKEFDEWLFSTGLTDWDAIPHPNDKAWGSWVADRNSYRAMLNDAASIGMHGHPPYRIDDSYTWVETKKRDGSKMPAKKKAADFWTVNLLTGMVAVTFNDMMKVMEGSLLRKNAEAAKMFDFFTERKSELPPEFQFTLESQQMLFENAVATATQALSQYVSSAKKTYERAQAAVAALPPAAPKTPALPQTEAAQEETPPAHKKNWLF